MCIRDRVYLRCVEQGLDPDIVVAKGEIDYMKPVDGDIVASSLPTDEADWTQFFEDFAERGRAKIALSSEVRIGDAVAARFSGLYAIVGVKA